MSDFETNPLNPPRKASMKYGSVCSGIEAATTAWHPLGWEASFFSEIEKFPRAVLSYHYPQTPLHGDFTTIERGDYESIDILVGGTPCQSFSVAGLRRGMDDERGNLALEFIKLAQRLRPRWIIWENVPGVLSSEGGRDFASFLGGLASCGFGWAYRSLDAQYFGLAQRRKRVFVVGYLGDWRRAAAVLFEPESLRWDNPPIREARKDVAPTISSRPTGGGGLGTDFDLDGGLIAAITVQAVAFGSNNQSGPIDVATAVNACHTASGRQDFQSETFVTHALRAHGFDASEDGTGRGTALVPISVALRGREGGATAELGDNVSTALRGACGGGDKAHVLLEAVRRLTPRECERLQGFPDDYTAIPYRHGIASDGPRYKALGNSMAVPVMRWIGQRIAAADVLV